MEPAVRNETIPDADQRKLTVAYDYIYKMSRAAPQGQRFVQRQAKDCNVIQEQTAPRNGQV